MKNLWKFRMRCQNAFTSSMPFNRVCKMLGLLPIYMTFDEKTMTASYHQSRLSVVYSLLIVFLGMLTVVPFFIPSSEEKVHSNVKFILRYMGVVKVSWYMIAASSQLLSVLIHSKNICNVFVKIDQIDDSLEKLGLKVNHRDMQRTALGAAVTIVTSLLTRIGVCLAIDGCGRSWSGCVHKMGIILNVFVRVFAMHSFIILVKLLRNRFVTLNNGLKQYIRKNSKKKLHFIGGGQLLLVQSITPGDDGRYSKDTKTYKMIDKYAILHHMLCDVIRMTNNIYGKPVLIGCSFTIFGLTIQIYYLYLMLTKGGMIRGNAIDIVECVTWMIEIVVEMFLFSYFCGTTTDQARTTANILKEMVIEESDNMTKISTELFLMQMLQLNMGFTAWDVFPLNMTTISMICSMVVGHVVILLQLTIQNNPKIVQ